MGDIGGRRARASCAGAARAEACRASAEGTIVFNGPGYGAHHNRQRPKTQALGGLGPNARGSLPGPPKRAPGQVN